MGRGHGAVGVVGEGLLELRVAAGRPERLHRLPHGHVQEGPAAGNAPVELGGDETGLGLQVGGIGGPGVEQGVGVVGFDVEGVDE